MSSRVFNRSCMALFISYVRDGFRSTLRVGMVDYSVYWMVVEYYIMQNLIVEEIPYFTI